VDETYGILRLIYSVADENLAVSNYDKRSHVIENMYKSSLAIGFEENEIKAVVLRSRKFLHAMKKFSKEILSFPKCNYCALFLKRNQ